MRKYKVFLIISFIVLFGGLFIFYLAHRPAVGISSLPMSSRMEAIKNSTDSIVPQASNEKITTPCVDFVLPFAHTNIKNLESDIDCSVSARLLNPVGQISLSILESSTDLHELSAVTFRKSQPQVYTYEVLKLGSFNEVLKFTSTDTVNYFIATGAKVITLSFTYLGNPNNIRDADVEVILKSLHYE